MRPGPGCVHYRARSITMKHTDESRIPEATLAIYARLQRGEAREEVTEANVSTLMKLAARDGHTVLQEELREWKAN